MLSSSVVTLGSRLDMASEKVCRPCIGATWNFFLGDANPNLPAVCSAGAACFPNRFTPGSTLEKAVAVMVIRPGMSRLARREGVRWSWVCWSWVCWSRVCWSRVRRRMRRRGCGSSSDKSGDQD